MKLNANSPKFLLALLVLAGLSFIFSLTNEPTRIAIPTHHLIPVALAPRSQLAQLSGAGSSLVGWWKFDEGSGTTVTDSSGNNASGAFQCSGINPNWITGHDGTGYALDFVQLGGSYCRLNLGNLPQFNITGPMSVSSWVKFTDAGNQVYVAKWGNTASYVLYASGGKFGFSISDGVNPQRATTAKVYNDGKWHMVTGVYDGTNVLIYVDGNMEIVTGSSYSGAVNSTSEYLSIGDYSVNGSTASLKQMDDVRLYNRALLAGEVATLYSSGGGTPLPRTTPPVRLNGAPTGTVAAGTTQTNISLTTDENATCRYAKTAGTAYAGMTSTFATTGGTAQSTAVSGLANGTQNTFYVRCQDAAGNTNTDDYPISFAVAQTNQTNITPPTISAISTSNIGTANATILWTTAPAADTQVDYGLTSIYDSHSALADTNPLVTSHTATLSGLQGNTVYHYRVDSHDSYGNLAVSTDHTFTTLVPAAATLVTPTNFRTSPGDWGATGTGLSVQFTWSTNTTDQMILESSTVDPATGAPNWTEINRSIVGGTTVGINNLPYNVKYWFRIRAYSGANVSGYSNVVPLTTLVIPALLAGTVNNAGSVSFIWQYYTFPYQTAAGSGYKLERSTDPTFPSSNTTVITVGQPYTITTDPTHSTINLVNYTDNFAFLSQTYYYRVRSFTSVGDGEPSPAIPVTPGIVPAAVTFSNVYTYADGGTSANKVKISFGPSNNNQTGYRIDRSLDGSTWATIGTYTTVPTSPIVDPSSGSLTAGLAYYYRVVAYNSVGDSSYTVKKVVIPAVPANSSSITSWFVDNSITGGTNDGSSWTNAWRNLSSINWDVIKPGDTIYISGGAAGQTYNEPLYVSQGGTAAAQVTIQTGTDAAHSGKVSITAGIVFLSQFVTIDGSKNPAFTFSSLESIVNNQNIDVTVNLLDAPCVYASALQGVKIRWLNIHDCGSPTGPNSLNGEVAGVLFNGFSGTSIAGSEIAYDHISNSWGQGIIMNGPADRYGLGAIHHNIIEFNHNDFIAGGGGIDIYNNIARNFIQPEIGHPDGFQIWPPYTRIYDNTIYDTPGQDVYIELNVPDDGHFQVYNNIMYVNHLQANSAIGASIELNNCNAAANPLVKVHDVLISNNLVYGLSATNFYGVSNDHGCAGSVAVSATTVKNNIFYALTGIPNNNVGIGGVADSSSQISFDYNVVTGGVLNTISYLGTNYPSVAAFNTAFPAYSHNTNSTPTFINPTGFDFRIASTDTVVGGKGANLSNYTDTNSCGATACVVPPGITQDFAGNPRSASGAWSIGPYESASTGSNTTAPTTPAGLASSNVTSTSVTLSWTASTATGGVGGYKIYRNGAEIGTAFTTSYIDTTVTSGATYSYTIKAYDNSNNISPASAAISVTTPLALNTDPSLVEHIDFQSGFANDPTAPNIFPDVSSHGNSGTRYFMGTTLNAGEGWPAQTTGPDGRTAALFRSYPDAPPVLNGGANYGSGDYVGVTKSASINNLAQATISVWAHYDANSIPAATLVDGGGYIYQVGSWRIGRDFSGMTYFSVFDTTSQQHDVIQFPDTTTCGGGHTTDTCNTSGWHLYTVTYDGTTATGYFDGVNIGSASLAQFGISKLIIGGLGNYLALGTWTHNGTPQWTDSDGYPNCCWMSGGMADFRIYNRALAPSEITNLFNATGGTNLTSAANTTPPSVANFKVGDTIQTTAAVNVRQTPSVSGIRLGTQSASTQGTVTGGPTYADGYWWWQIHYQYSPQDGWSVENYLTKYANGTLPSASTTLPDTTPPSVSITAPLSGATISGTAVPIAMTATDPIVSGQTTSGVASLQIQIDGVNVQNALLTTPTSGSTYSGTLDTTTIPNGSHTISVVAMDVSRNMATSVAIPVTVSNVQTNPGPASAPSPSPSATPTSAASPTPSVTPPLTNGLPSPAPTPGVGGTGNTSPNTSGVFTPSVPQNPLVTPTTPVSNAPVLSNPCPVTIPAAALTLTLGTRSQDVTNLQTFLVFKGYLQQRYITGYFGNLTKAALNAYLSARATGNCNAVGTAYVTGATSPTAVTNPVSTNYTGSAFTRSLKHGSVGEDVRQLQTFLNNHGYVISTSGAGSPGHESTFFGLATMRALSAFQRANHITPSYGYFGPVTMRRVNGLLGF